MICSSKWSRQVCTEPRKYCVSLDLFIHTPLINLEDRKLCNFPTTGIRALVIRIRIFLVCSVVAALTDLPHQKRIFLKPYFFSINFQARLLFT